MTVKATTFQVRRPGLSSDSRGFRGQIPKEVKRNLTGKNEAILAELTAARSWRSQDGSPPMVHCVVTKDGRLKTIELVVGQALPRGNFEIAPDGAQTTSLERGKVQRIYDLRAFEKAVNDLGNESSPLDIDPKLVSVLQNFFEVSIENRSRHREKHIRKSIQAKVTELKGKPFQIQDLLHIIRPFSRSLPFSFALNLIDEFFSSTVSEERTATAHMIRFYMDQGRFNAPGNREDFDSSSFFTHPVLSRFFNNLSDATGADLALVNVSVQSLLSVLPHPDIAIPRLLQNYASPALYQNIIRFKGAEGPTFLIDSLRGIIPSLDPNRLLEIFNSVAQMTSQPIDFLSTFIDRALGETEMDRFLMAHSSPELYGQIIRAKRGDGVPYMVNCLCRIYPRLGQDDLLKVARNVGETQTPGNNFYKEFVVKAMSDAQAMDKGSDQKLIIMGMLISRTKYNATFMQMAIKEFLSHPASQILRVVKTLNRPHLEECILVYLDEHRKEIHPMNLQVAEIAANLYIRFSAQKRVQHRGVIERIFQERIHPKLFGLLTANLLEAGWSTTEIRDFCNLALSEPQAVSLALNLAGQIESFDLRSKNGVELATFTLALNIKYRTGIEFSLVEIFDSADLRHLLALPADLLEVWSECLLQNFKTTQLLHTHVPTLPIDDIPVATDAEVQAFLTAKGYPDFVQEGIRGLWDKAATVQRQMYKDLFRQYVSKVVDLNRQGEVSDEAARAFFENLHDQGNMCWEGLVDKTKNYFRRATLSPASVQSAQLRPSQDVNKLRARIAQIAEGAASEDYAEFSDVMRTHAAELEELAERLLKSDTEDVASAVRSMVEKLSKSSQKVPNELFAEVAGMDDELNSRDIKIIYYLSQSQSGLTAKEILTALSLPHHMAAHITSLIRSLLKKESGSAQVEEKGGTFTLNKNHPQVKKVLGLIASALSKDKTSGGGGGGAGRSKEEKLESATRHALAVACSEGKLMRELQSEQDQINLKLSLITYSNEYFEEWIKAKANPIKLMLIYSRISDTAFQLLQDLPNDEERVRFVRNNYNQMGNSESDRQFLRNVSSTGNEVHVLRAVQDTFSNELGFAPHDATAADHDGYSDRYREAVISSPAIAKLMLKWREGPTGGEKQAFLEYLASKLNGNGPASESIDKFGSINASVHTFMEGFKADKAYPTIPAKLCEACFTPSAEGQAPRITPHGVNTLLLALKLTERKN